MIYMPWTHISANYVLTILHLEEVVGMIWAILTELSPFILEGAASSPWKSKHLC